MARLPGIHSAREPRDLDADRPSSPFALPPIPLGHMTQSTLGGAEWSWTKIRADGLATMQLIGGAHGSPRKQKTALRMAKKACLKARAVLQDELQEKASVVEGDTAELVEQLTAAIDATTYALVGSRKLTHRAIRCRLFTYRAMAFTWTDALDKALADLKEALQLHGQDTLALKCQARLRDAFASRFKAENPARFVPTCKSHADFLRQNGHESGALAAFDNSVDRVRRDRPYPEWFERRGIFCAPV